MKLFTILSLFMISVCFGSTVDIEAEHLSAIDQQKGLLVKMTASWCGPCRQFDQNIGSKERFKSALVSNNLKFLILDYSKGIKGDILARYVNFFGSGMPTVILLNPQGVQQIINGDRPFEENYTIIKSRSLYGFEQHKSIIEEINLGSLNLNI